MHNNERLNEENQRVRGSNKRKIEKKKNEWKEINHNGLSWKEMESANL